MSTQASDGSSATVGKLAKTLLDRLGSKASRIMACCGDEDCFLSVIAHLSSAEWSERSSRPGEEIDLLMVSAESADDCVLAEYLARTPPAVLVRFRDEHLKKEVFIFLESKGYRIFQELRDYVLFFRFLRGGCFGDDRRLGDAEVQRKLQSSRRAIRNIPNETVVKFGNVPARDLLNARRFDIAIKVNYARLYLAGQAKQWREYAYLEHALRITGPGKTIREYDGSGKEGPAAFLSGFHSLLDEKDFSNIPAVPIDPEYTAFDGAHRVAAGIARNERVNCAVINHRSGNDASAQFFLGTTHGHSGCFEEILDEAALEYCRVKDTAAIVLIFPSVPSPEAALDMLSGIGNIVYRKDVVLSPAAGGALLRQVYLGQPWLDWSGRESGFKYKQRCCFPFSGVLRALLIDDFNPMDLRPAKERIRRHYGLGNHSIHITDSTEETLRVGGVLFNRNSLETLERGVGDFEDFHARLFDFRRWMLVNGVDENSVCVDSSAVLSVLGLRECRDLDFLYHGDQSMLPKVPHGIDCHNDQAHYYGHTVEDIVGDPRLHFWYMGVKFCTPWLVRDMKRNRGEPKDLVDVRMLEATLPPRYTRILYLVRSFVLRRASAQRARMVMLVRRVKTHLRPAINRLRKRTP